MKYKNIFWGIVLIVIGVLFVLKNLNIIQFNWVYLIELWPLLLIFWGISLLPVRDFIKLALYLIALIAGVYLVNTSNGDSFWYWKFKNYNENRFIEQTIEKEYNTSYKTANLKLSAVSGNFDIKGNTDKLINFTSKGSIGKYKISEKSNDSTIFIDLGLESNIVSVDKSEYNQCKLLLNTKPLWNLFFEAGASNINIELSDLKVEKIRFEGGASNMNVTLGNKHPNTSIYVEAGVSSIKINIPKSSGCELIMDNVLSSRKIDGFSKINDNIFRTENYDTATEKIKINIEAAVSKFEINRY